MNISDTEKTILSEGLILSQSERIEEFHSRTETQINSQCYKHSHENNEDPVSRPERVGTVPCSLPFLAETAENHGICYYIDLVNGRKDERSKGFCGSADPLAELCLSRYLDTTACLTVTYVRVILHDHGNVSECKTHRIGNLVAYPEPVE